MEESSEPLPLITRKWWQKEIPPLVVLTICLLGILSYWGIGLLGVYDVLGKIPYPVYVLVYYVHWSSVGGLIQFVLSKKRKVLHGAIIGAIVSALLVMCAG